MNNVSDAHLKKKALIAGIRGQDGAYLMEQKRPKIKVSIITVVYNNREYIKDCVQSVLGQTYENIEYIVIDGGSTDGTLNILEEYREKIDRIISEPDRGACDAMNKGIKIASGDIIAILMSDDIYFDESVLEKVVKIMADDRIESCYGDLVYVDRTNTDKIVRYWKAGEFYRDSLRRGWMPPHPTLFIKKEVYLKYGVFNTEYKIANDYDLILRLLWKYGISIRYVPEVLVRMRMGGESNRSFKNIIRKSREDLKTIRQNGVGGLWTLFMKNISKIPQYCVRKDLFIPTQIDDN